MDRTTAVPDQLHPQHLRGILEREARAQRAYDEAKAQALLDTCAETNGDGGPLDLAHATLTAKVGRAHRKLTEARIERAMAEYLLVGHFDRGVRSRLPATPTLPPHELAIPAALDALHPTDAKTIKQLEADTGVSRNTLTKTLALLAEWGLAARIGSERGPWVLRSDSPADAGQ
jgi:hypothetical protein